MYLVAVAVSELSVLVDDGDRVAAVQRGLPSADVVDRAAALFDALSDPGRLRLLASLTVTDELCVCDLAAAAGMRESTTSHALRLLRTSHLVTARREGRSVYYSLGDAHVRHLLHDVFDHVRHS
jgi:ArsR family transcriptional regulator, lead/cadmium/zinc/bismuth-responsive transcriptional repressor